MQLTFKTLLPLAFALASFGQTSPTSPITRVMATLTVKDGFTQEQFAKVMPQEVRSTVQIYLDGKIEQWWARGDGKGVVFIVDCKSVEEAKALLEGLPLVKEKLATFEYMPLRPLTPLRILMRPAGQ